MILSSIPNIISVIRILLVLPVWWCLMEERWSTAFVLFAIAGLSDGVDGYLARRFKWQSRLGGFLDPAADKLLMTVVYIMLAVKGVLPVYLTAVVIGRDLVIVAGASAYYWLFGPYKAAPSTFSKFNTVVQIVLVVVALGTLSFYPAGQWLVPMLTGLCVATVLISGLEYVFVWWSKAVRNKKND